MKKQKLQTNETAALFGALAILAAALALFTSGADAPALLGDAPFRGSSADNPVKAAIEAPVLENTGNIGNTSAPGATTLDYIIYPLPEEVSEEVSAELSEEASAEANAEPASIPAPISEAEAHLLARLIWGEARGVPSKMERAAVVWCVLNRADSEKWPDTLSEVVTQKGQFNGYSPSHPVTEEHKALAADVYARWQSEKQGAANVGRVLPADYVFFTGHNGRNRFRNAYRNGDIWDFSAVNPYED